MLLRSLEIFSSALFGLDVLVFAIGSCESINQTSSISRLKLLTLRSPKSQVQSNGLLWVEINFKRPEGRQVQERSQKPWSKNLVYLFRFFFFSSP